MARNWIFDHFNIIAPYYEKIFGRQSEMDWAKMFLIEPGMTVLDLGGGTGRISQHFLSNERTIIVADASVGMLEQAKLKNGIVPINCLAENLPFCEKSFNRIIVVDALHHVIDQAATVKEAFRALMGGGILIIHEPDIDLFFVKLIALGEKILQMRSHFLTHEQIMNLFSGLPVEIRSLRDRGSLWFYVTRHD